MICPDGYFTPKSLESGYAKALAFPSVRQTVFSSAGQSTQAINPSDLDSVSQSVACIFLHHFIENHRHEARLFDNDSRATHRIDEWAMVVTGKLPFTLPETKQNAISNEARLNRRLVFFDQELWVLDSERLNDVSETDQAIGRVLKLAEGLDGWSLCYPISVFPKDLGASMNDFAKAMAAQKSIPAPKQARVGRPNKVDRVVEAVKQIYPNGIGDRPQKEVFRTVKKEIQDGLGMTTLRKALAKTHSSESQGL